MTEGSHWKVYLNKSAVWWNDEQYEMYARILYEDFKHLLVLGLIPFLLLVYFNAKIYKGIKFPQNGDIQQQEVFGGNYRDRKLANVLIGIVIIFFVCHSTRIVWYLNYTVINSDVINCPKLHPTASGQPPWTFVMAIVYDLCLVINSSVNTIVYCTLNPKFRYNIVRLLKYPCRRALNNVTSNEDPPPQVV